MSNITLDTTNFSEQLGLYDFFDVIVSGSVAIFGISMLNDPIKEFLWKDTTIAKGLGIAVLIYILGNLVQELGAKMDECLFKVKKRTRSTFLFDIQEKKEFRNDKSSKTVEKTENMDKLDKKKKWNCVVNNNDLLNHYRSIATEIYAEYFPNAKEEDKKNYNDEKFNSFIFSIIQYRVSHIGKEAKEEKLRALYSLSRDLIVCFGAFVIYIIIIFFHALFDSWKGDPGEIFKIDWSTLEINPHNGFYLVVFGSISIVCGIIFFFRMKKCKKYRALIMLGNYDASLYYRKNESDDKLNPQMDIQPSLIADAIARQTCIGRVGTECWKGILEGSKTDEMLTKQGLNVLVESTEDK